MDINIIEGPHFSELAPKQCSSAQIRLEQVEEGKEYQVFSDTHGEVLAVEVLGLEADISF